MSDMRSASAPAGGEGGDGRFAKMRAVMTNRKLRDIAQGQLVRSRARMRRPYPCLGKRSCAPDKKGSAPASGKSTIWVSQALLQREAQPDSDIDLSIRYRLGAVDLD
jgi:hypothetical protein